MGKHNLRRIVNLQKWEKSVMGNPATEQNHGKQGEHKQPLNGPVMPPCLSPECLKHDLEQLEQLKYKKLK